MDSRISHAIRFMKQDLSRKTTEEEMARQVGLTPQHFCVLFKADTDETPMHFLRRLRLEEAQRLLESDQHLGLSIKEIASAVGSRDISHFVRDFERTFGLSPKRYRFKKTGRE